MCGLAGVAGNIGPVDTTVFEELVYLAGLRGKDATGFAAIPNLDNKGRQPPAVLMKSPSNAYEFLDRKSVRAAIKLGNSTFLGHCRYGTSGGSGRDEAQPFEFSHIIGTHNGTLSLKAYAILGGKKIFPTDSAALYYNIDKRGLKETLDMLDDDDAMALAWWDSTDNTLNFYRNTQRPLWYAFDSTYSTIYWSSEPGMLYMSLNRNKVKFKNVKELDPFTHMVLTLPGESGYKFIRPDMVKIKMKKHYEPKMIGSSAKDAADAFLQGSQREFPFTTTRSISGPITSPGVATSSIIQFSDYTQRDPKWKLNLMQHQTDGIDYYKDDNNCSYDEKAFDKSVSHGCCIDGVIPSFGEPVKFLRDGAFACATCFAEAKSDKNPVVRGLIADALL